MNGDNESQGPRKPDAEQKGANPNAQSGQQGPRLSADTGKPVQPVQQPPAAVAGQPAGSRQEAAKPSSEKEKPAPPTTRQTSDPKKERRSLGQILSALGGRSSKVSPAAKEELLVAGAKILAGRNIRWWRDIVRGEMQRAYTAETNLAKSRKELEEALAAAAVSESKIAELRGRVGVLEQEVKDAKAAVQSTFAAMRSLSQENDELQKEVRSLEEDVERLRAMALTDNDFDNLFDMTVGPMQDAVDGWRKEIWRQ